MRLKLLVFFSVSLFLGVLVSSGCKPTNPYLYVKRGNEEYKRGDYRKAEEMFQEALKRKNDLPEAYYGLGLVYYQQRKIDKAIEMFQKARDLKPDLVEAYYQEALIYQLMGRDKQYEAIPLYEKVLEIKPDFREARMNLGLMYEKLGAFEQAKAVYEAGLKQNPNDPEIKEALQRVLDKLPPEGMTPPAPPPEEETSKEGSRE